MKHHFPDLQNEVHRIVFNYFALVGAFQLSLIISLFISTHSRGWSLDHLTQPKTDEPWIALIIAGNESET